MKKFLKYFLIGIAALTVIIAALLAQSFYRVDVRIFPINQHIQAGTHPWGAMVNLIPDDFNVGESLETVASKLKFSGYKNIPVENAWQRYKDKVGKNKFMYVRDANMLVCNISLYVFVEFDDNGKLISAQGTQHEHGCL